MKNNDNSLRNYIESKKRQKEILEETKKRRLQNTIDDYTKAIKIDPSNARFYFFRASSKDEQEDYQGAIDDYTKAIELESNSVFIEYFYNRRASAKRKLGDNKGACEDWKKAAELGSEDAAELLKKHCEN